MQLIFLQLFQTFFYRNIRSRYGLINVHFALWHLNFQYLYRSSISPYPKPQIAVMNVSCELESIFFKFLASQKELWSFHFECAGCNRRWHATDRGHPSQASAKASVKGIGSNYISSQDRINSGPQAYLTYFWPLHAFDLCKAFCKMECAMVKRMSYALNDIWNKPLCRMCIYRSSQDTKPRDDIMYVYLYCAALVWKEAVLDVAKSEIQCMVLVHETYMAGGRNTFVQKV